MIFNWIVFVAFLLTMIQLSDCRRGGGGRGGRGGRGGSCRRTSSASYKSHYAPAYHSPAYNARPRYIPPPRNYPPKDHSAPVYRPPPAYGAPPAYQLHADYHAPPAYHPPPPYHPPDYNYHGSYKLSPIELKNPVKSSLPVGPSVNSPAVDASSRGKGIHRKLYASYYPYRSSSGDKGSSAYTKRYSKPMPSNYTSENFQRHYQLGSYGRWTDVPPVYTAYNTGSTALGIFLGYALSKVSTPSYIYYNSYYDGYGYIPKYDHYTIHHYYHDRETIPTRITVAVNTIVACPGDSGSFCPINTTSLCTDDGEVMCVTKFILTVPCLQNKVDNCVRSSVPCRDNYSLACQQSSKDTAKLLIPCISTANVYGNITSINDTIIASNIVETEDPQVFCVTVLAVPAERDRTPGEKIFSHIQRTISKFALKTFGVH